MLHFRTKTVLIDVSEIDILNKCYYFFVLFFSLICMFYFFLSLIWLLVTFFQIFLFKIECRDAVLLPLCSYYPNILPHCKLPNLHKKSFSDDQNDDKEQGFPTIWLIDYFRTLGWKLLRYKLIFKISLFSFSLKFKCLNNLFFCQLVF